MLECILAFLNATVDRIRRRRGMTQTGEQAPRTPLLQPPPDRPSPYERFVRIGITAWCGIGVIVLGYLLLRLMVYVNPVIPPLLIAVAVVYLLNPVVSALERRGVPRVAGAGIVYLLFLCIVALIPPGRRDEIRGLMDRIGQAVGGFFRGQLLVALFVGVASSIGLWLIGLPFWLLVGMVAGVFNLVPLVGPFIGGGLAVIIALISGQPLKAVWAALVLLVVQQIDNHLISPNVMGRTVQLHPVVVMLALLVGASFAGLFGMLVIVPLVAVVKIVFLFIWSKYVDYGDELTQGSPE
jgi:predicted PurR-regulated permease PerM